MLLLAIDDHSLPFRRHLAYYLTKPDVRKEPVLSPSSQDPNAPDHRVANFYGTVLHDEGRFRMWYYAMNELQQRPNETSMIGYAESDDSPGGTEGPLQRATGCKAKTPLRADDRKSPLYESVVVRSGGLCGI